MEFRITTATRPLAGDLRLPTDKSISHRAVLLAAMAEGESNLTGVLDSADVRATIAAAEALGATLEVVEASERGLRMRIAGWGARGPVTPADPIDCGNSGTTARLLMGVIAGWPITVTLTGDESLSTRPMARVTGPLAAMGAHIITTPAGTLPVTITGGDLRGAAYVSPVASAQVKSAVLLAGLRAAGTTTVTEPAPSRDHTERMLPAFGVAVTTDAEMHAASLTGPVVVQAADVIVPADPSSAAFVTAAAMLVAGSHVRLPNVSANPTRTAFVRVLERMGARVRLSELPAMGLEPVATIDVRHTEHLRATLVTAAEVPALIDEVPVLALLATQADGTTRFEGVAELRVKESDRLEAVRAGLEALGAQVEAGEDWLAVTGPAELTGARLPSLGDHRLAMTWAVAGLIATGETVVEGFEAVDVSYPRFADDLAALGSGLL